MTEARVASLNPNDAVQGGMLDDVDVIIESARFALWDYNGKSKTVPALRVQYKDGEDKLHEQYYSCGDIERFVPSDDGKKLLLLGTATALSTGSNVVQYLTSLMNAGFPAAKLVEDVSTLDGLRCHVQRVTQAKRAGIVQTDDKDRSILLVTKILADVGKAKATGPKAVKAATAAPATAAAPTTDADTLAPKTIEYIVAAAVGAGGAINRQAISQKVFQLAMAAKDADKAAVCKLAFDEAFLTANCGPRFADDGTPIASFDYDSASKAISAEMAVAA